MAAKDLQTPHSGETHLHRSAVLGAWLVWDLVLGRTVSKVMLPTEHAWELFLLQSVSSDTGSPFTPPYTLK